MSLARAKRRVWPCGGWLLILPLAGLAACEGKAGAGEGTQPQQAPDFAAVSLAGDSVSLHGERGSVVLLNIWATWCPPCREEMPLLQRLQEENGAAGLRVVGVSVDARGEEPRIREFIEDHGITFQIWLDPDERVPLLFRAIGVPWTYLIDREGVLVWKHAGPLLEGDRNFAIALENALSGS